MQSEQGKTLGHTFNYRVLSTEMQLLSCPIFSMLLHVRELEGSTKPRTHSVSLKTAPPKRTSLVLLSKPISEQGESIGLS